MAWTSGVMTVSEAAGTIMEAVVAELIEQCEGGMVMVHMENFSSGYATIEVRKPEGK